MEDLSSNGTAKIIWHFATRAFYSLIKNITDDDIKSSASHKHIFDLIILNILLFLLFFLSSCSTYEWRSHTEVPF